MALILVTGSSTGLGLNAAQALVDEGHEVVVHARSAARIEGQPWLQQLLGAVHGDLGTHEGARAVAEAANAFGRFDAVIHNAGVMDGPVAEVNVDAPYLMTALMERPARLVYLSSDMHRGGSASLRGLSGRGRVSYSDSKLYVTALAMAVARLWDDVCSHAVDPGWVPTRMGGSGAPDDLTAGHQTQTWLATADNVKPRTGGYWYHRSTQTPHRSALDENFQDELLAVLESRTGIALPR
ncbi:SDR family NAD(P)-dependent oxidoreductase [Aestuariimicrobium ganziense]|uniref:SDR family NAD(P)-dependent oxidoreductase n=1 Tax=Aestuariimicrobium ganziense TaxID=2773677 RepID=UPI0019437945|nr:SDR family NAD(P)-dependent oxidoreductase [Aestuariimicrobium ganziense]